MLLIAPALILHFLLATYFFSDGISEKSLFSIPIFLIMTFVAYELGQISTKKDWINLEKISLLILALAIFFILIEANFPELFPKQKTYRMGKVFSGFFNEPSHLAFSIFPCILIALFSKYRYRFYFGIIFVIAFAILSPSSTYLSLMLIAGLTILFKRYKFQEILLFLPIFIFLLYSYLILFRPLTLLDLQNKFTNLFYALFDVFTPWFIKVTYIKDFNLSALVYIQGWSDAILNFLATWGLGRGFNTMGEDPIPLNAARSVITSTGFEGLNNQDGSFLFAKGISEFGIFFLIPFAILSLRSFKNIFQANQNLIKDYDLIKWLIVFSFIVTSLIRSSGFFCGTFAILIFAISALRVNKNEKIHANR